MAFYSPKVLGCKAYFLTINVRETLQLKTESSDPSYTFKKANIFLVLCVNLINKTSNYMITLKKY